MMVPGRQRGPEWDLQNPPPWGSSAGPGRGDVSSGVSQASCPSSEHSHSGSEEAEALEPVSNTFLCLSSWHMPTQPPDPSKMLSQARNNDLSLDYHPLPMVAAPTVPGAKVYSTCILLLISRTMPAAWRLLLSPLHPGRNWSSKKWPPQVAKHQPDLSDFVI